MTEDKARGRRGEDALQERTPSGRPGGRDSGPQRLPWQLGGGGAAVCHRVKQLKLTEPLVSCLDQNFFLSADIKKKQVQVGRGGACCNRVITHVLRRSGYRNEIEACGRRGLMAPPSRQQVQGLGTWELKGTIV